MLQVEITTPPMTREEIVAYRPGQDPEYDPTAAQAAPPAPKQRAMTTADIAAYRPGEDPAYDPVERRGWWEVNIAEGSTSALAYAFCMHFSQANGHSLCSACCRPMLCHSYTPTHHV